MVDVLHKNLSGADLHNPKTHAGSHIDGGSDQIQSLQDYLIELPGTIDDSSGAIDDLYATSGDGNPLEVSVPFTIGELRYSIGQLPLAGSIQFKLRKWTGAAWSDLTSAITVSAAAATWTDITSSLVATPTLAQYDNIGIQVIDAADDSGVGLALRIRGLEIV